MIPQHLLHNLNLSSIAVTPAIAADGTLKPGPSMCYCRHCLVSGAPFCVWGCSFAYVICHLYHNSTGSKREM